MRIGTITFWWCHENYGQILQVFAFQQYLKKLGHDSFLIRYMARSHFKTSLLSFLGRAMRNPFAAAKTLLSRLDGSSRARERRRFEITPQRDFEGFRQKYLSMSSGIYYSYKELCGSTEIDADCYSVGSDVVWKNFPMNDDGRPMFLDFGMESVTRFAYSASFGTDVVTDEFKNYVKPLIARIDLIGVREDSGVSICASMGRSDAVHVLDPVLLLSKDEYYNVLGLTDSPRMGVFGYYLNSSTPFPIDEIRSLPEFSTEKIEVATVYGDMSLPKSVLVNPTIPEWIKRIASSRLFVTNSFHGASLAIITHTPFIVLLKHKGEDMDSRLISLLKQFGLIGRVRTVNNTLEEIMHTNIDWERVDKILSAERLRTRAFLSRIGV